MFGKKLGNSVDPSITPHGSLQMTPCETPHGTPQGTPRGSLSRIPRKINGRTPCGSSSGTPKRTPEETMQCTTSRTSPRTPQRITPNLEISITSPKNTSQISGYYVLFKFKLKNL